MADIALFVAEDFERRMKMWEKGEQHGGFEFSSTMSMASSALSVVEAKLAEKLAFMQEEVAKRVMEPQSPLSLAAINGFFSA